MFFCEKRQVALYDGMKLLIYESFLSLVYSVFKELLIDTTESYPSYTNSTTDHLLMSIPIQCHCCELINSIRRDFFSICWAAKIVTKTEMLFFFIFGMPTKRILTDFG